MDFNQAYPSIYVCFSFDKYNFVLLIAFSDSFKDVSKLFFLLALLLLCEQEAFSFGRSFRSSLSNDLWAVYRLHIYIHFYLKSK